MGEQTKSREHAAKAYSLKDRVSEPERLYITARYYQTVEGADQKTIDTYQSGFKPTRKTSCRTRTSRTSIRTAASSTRRAEDSHGDFAGARRAAAVRQSRRSRTLSQSKPDEARATLDEAIARGIDSVSFRTRAVLARFPPARRSRHGATGGGRQALL